MNKIIKNIISTSYISKEGHIASSLSILDILYVLYDKILDIEKLNDRDRFILSKGHASLGLYSILDYFNLLNYDLNDFCKFDSILGGHPSDKIPYVESSTGSLGHGLPLAIGIAMGYKIQNFNHNVYVVIGDGEANEGTIWESAFLASHHKLNNLYCIMDYNHSGDRALKIDNIFDKFKSFNWDCQEIDGHNQIEIEKSLLRKSDKPLFILANTIKGKGCKMMENNPEWHHKFPTEEEYKKLIEQL
jgi:transketolase